MKLLNVKSEEYENNGSPKVGDMVRLSQDIENGVDVLIVCPSFIDTGIDRAALGADGQPATHSRKTTGQATQPVEVADAIFQAAQQRRTLLLFSFTAKAAWWLSRLWPTRYAAIMKRRLRAEIFPDTTP